MVATVGRAANQNIRNFATKTDIAILKSDIAVIKSDVDLLKSDVGVVKSGIAIPRSDIEGRIMRMTLYLAHGDGWSDGSDDGLSGAVFGGWRLVARV